MARRKFAVYSVLIKSELTQISAFDPVSDWRHASILLLGHSTDLVERVIEIERCILMPCGRARALLPS